MTRIADLLQQGQTWSFEFSPPKTPEGLVAFDEAERALAELAPSFVSVTYGALGSTRDTTRDLVLRVDQARPYPAMPHLTCVGHTRADLVDLVTHYRDHGVENILALAGDPPADGSPADGDFTYATELVDLVREVGDFSVGVAAFPEMHPRSTDGPTDRKWLAHKLGQVDFAITQFFFDVGHYVRLIDDLTELGCDTPVIPGVMPFVSVAGLRRMAALNNTRIPDELQVRLDRVEGDPEATRALGVAVATDLVQQLLDVGVPGVHLYAMNRSTSISEIYAALGKA